MITKLNFRPEFAAGTPAVLATAATKTLTVDTQPTAGDTLTVDDLTYTFVADGAQVAALEIEVGTDLATAQAAILAAIDGSDGFNVVNPYITASAFSTNVSTITPVGTGFASNVDFSETFTAGGNVFNGSLVGGTDATVAHKGSFLFDDTNIYIATAHDTFRKVAHSAL